MVYTVQTGLLTSIFTLVCLITYAVMPHNFVFLGLLFSESKCTHLLCSIRKRRPSLYSLQLQLTIILYSVYTNALLANLNSRDSVRERFTGQHMVVSLSAMHTGQHHIESKVLAGGSSHCFGTGSYEIQRVSQPQGGGRNSGVSVPVETIGDDSNEREYDTKTWIDTPPPTTGMDARPGEV
jgi:hypothetical protein